MSLTKLGLIAFALLLYSVSFSQPICGFDGIHGKKMKDDSIYRDKILRYESNLREYIRQNSNLLNRKGPKTLAGPYTIPVVVHVVHTGGTIGSTYNPSDAQIQGAIDYLNAVYNGSFPGTQGVGDLGIQFVLAKRDPNCNPTNGITRTDGSSITGYAANGVMRSVIGADELDVLVEARTAAIPADEMDDPLDGPVSFPHPGSEGPAAACSLRSATSV